MVFNCLPQESNILTPLLYSLRKHAYSNILRILPPKTEKKLSDEKFWLFSYFGSKHRLWYLLEPPRRGGSTEYQQSMFLSRNKKINVNPSFSVYKWGLRGSKLYRRVFVMLPCKPFLFSCLNIYIYTKFVYFNQMPYLSYIHPLVFAHFTPAFSCRLWRNTTLST